MIADNALKYFDGKKALVTGGTGLIGRQVVDILVSAGCQVTIVSLDDYKVNEAAEHVKGDLSDFSTCKQLTQGMDCVFHLAGIKGSIKVTTEKPASFFVPLLMMNTNLLEAARLAAVPKLVYTSSIGAYSSAEIFKETENLDGPPMDSFPGWAKRMAERQIEAYRIQYGIDEYAVVRPANVYGPGDNFDPENAMVVPSLMSRILSGESPMKIWGDGSAIRDLLYSRDAAEGIVLALYHGTPSGFVNIGSGIGYTIKQLVETLASIIGFDYEFDTSKPSGFPKRIMSIDLAKETIDYCPSTSLEEGLRLTWEWFKEHSEEYLLRKNYFREKS